MAEITRRKTRFAFGLRDAGSTLAKSAAAVLTETEVMHNSRITQSGDGVKITLPVAAAKYKGIRLLIGSIHASSSTNTVYVAAGFGAGAGSFDTVTLPALGSVIVDCDGTYWYAIGQDPGAG